MFESYTQCPRCKKAVGLDCNCYSGTTAGHYLTKYEYQEYQDLKRAHDRAIELATQCSGTMLELHELRKFKADCDKDIQEWDKGYTVVSKDGDFALVCDNCGIQLEHNLEETDVCECCQPEGKPSWLNDVDNSDLIDETFETIEDRLEDLEGDMHTIKDDLAGQWGIQRIKDMNIIRRLGELEDIITPIRCATVGKGAPKAKANTSTKASNKK